MIKISVVWDIFLETCASAVTVGVIVSSARGNDCTLGENVYVTLIQGKVTRRTGTAGVSCMLHSKSYGIHNVNIHI